MDTPETDDDVPFGDLTTMWNISLTNTTNTPVNQSTVELLEQFLGPRYRNLAESTILTIVYSLIFMTGLIGNVSTCIIISNNRYMHTATNYYLFSMAVSDVLTLILGLPPELYAVWEAYPWRLGASYCLFKTFLTEMTSSASILTISAFTVERYIAICHPIKAQTMCNLSRAVKVIGCIWFSAALSALPYPIHTRSYYYVLQPETQLPLDDSLICNIRPEWIPRMCHVFQFSTFLLFVLPMGLISYLYILIGITLRRSGLTRQTSQKCSPTKSQSTRCVLRMLVAVVVAFFVCWAPFHAQRLMTVYIRDTDWTPTLIESQNILFYISGMLYFVSCTVNPILYNLMSKKYRQAFKDTLCWCFLPGSVRGRRFRRQSAWERSTQSSYQFTSRRHNSVITEPKLSRNLHNRVTSNSTRLVSQPRHHKNPHSHMSDSYSDDRGRHDGNQLYDQRMGETTDAEVMDMQRKHANGCVQLNVRPTKIPVDMTDVELMDVHINRL